MESVDETTETVGRISCSTLVLYVEFLRKWGGANNVAEGRQGERI